MRQANTNKRASSLSNRASAETLPGEGDTVELFYKLGLLLTVFLLLGLAPRYSASQAAGDSSITLTQPLNGAVFAPQVAPTFQWESNQVTQFKVQFSADLSFPPDQTLAIPASTQSLVPTAAAWKKIEQIENKRQVVHWRVIANDGGGNSASNEVRSFFVTANPPLNNKLVTAVDLSLPGRGLSTQVARTYLIDSTNSGPLGPRWTHSYNMSLQEFSDGLVKLFNQDGTESFFIPAAGGGYEALPGDFRTLTKNGDGTFVLRGKFGLVFNFDANGKLVSLVDPNGNQMTLAYNSDGLLETVTDPSDRAAAFAYNSDKRIESITDPVGRVVHYGYDALGNLNSVTNAAGFQTSYGYNPNGRLNKITDPNGNSTSISYDGKGRLRSSANKSGVNRLAYQYAPASDTAEMTVTDALGNQTTFTLGHNGNYGAIISLENPLTNTTSFTYDDDRNLTSVTDANGNVTTFTYDDRGSLLTKTDAQNNVTTFTYESTFNKIKSLTDANGNATTFEYDAKGNLLKTTYPDGSFESFTYDAFGNNLTTTDRRGMTQSRTYNDNGQRLTNTFATNTVSFSYDAAGNLASLTDPSGTITHSYDALNRITAVGYPGGQSLNYQYDAVGNRTTVTYPDGRKFTYNYDTANRLKSISGPAGAVVTYNYDKASRRARKTLGNGVFTTYTYDAAAKLLELANKKSSGTVISSFTYTYDTLGNRVSVTDASGTHLFEYDAINQLAIHKGPAGATSYNFDALGNRTDVTENGATNSYTPNTLNQYIFVGNTSYQYDDDGNLISRDGPEGITTFDYDVGGRLSEVNTPQGVFKYGYDLFGRRTSKTDANGMIRFIYDGPHIAMEIDEEDESVAVYAYGAVIDEVLLMERGGQSFWYTQDGLGSVVDLTDASQNVVESYSYDPYGKPSITSSVGNRFMFTGREYDADTRLYYYRARYYDPGLGRFVSVDDIKFIELDSNRYSYVKNNPINYVDPYGLLSESDIRKFGGLACTLVGGVVAIIPPAITVYIVGPIPGTGGFIVISTAIGAAAGAGVTLFCNNVIEQLPEGQPVQSGDPTFIQAGGVSPKVIRRDEDIHGLIAEIRVPYKHSLVLGNVPIFGLAHGKDFKEYRVEYGEGTDPSTWTTISTSTTARTKDVTPADLDDSADITIHGNLATWDTGLKNYVYLPSHPKDHPIDLKGAYTVRLLVTGKDGRTAEDRVTVEVGDVIPNAWGGIAQSKDGKIVLNIPEQALRDSFRLISMKPAEKAPAPLPSGHQIIGSIYEFREPSERFTKESVLEMDVSENEIGTTNAEKVGVYAYNAKKKDWEYLTSSRYEQSEKVFAKVKELSPYYALMVSDVSGEGSALVERPKADDGMRKVGAAIGNGHYLVQDTFEEARGEWSNRDGDVGADVSLDDTATFDGTRSLKISNTNFGGNFAVNMRTTPFDAREYPVVQFDYRISPDVKTDFLVKVAGRWYNIGFTDDPKDLTYKRVNIANIGYIEGVVADNKWHTARFNLYDMLRTKTGNHIVEAMVMADWDVAGYMKLVFGRNREKATYYIDNFTISREVSAGLKIDSDTILVDNFNQRKETNALGGASSIFAAPDGGRLQTAFSDEKGERKGHALKLSYDVSQPGSYAGKNTSLQNLDVREFKTLRFLIKGGQGRNLLVGLKDRSGRESKVRASHYLPKKQLPTSWQPVEIPLAAFSDINDWGGLDNLSLSFENGLRIPSGEVYADDIAFSKALTAFAVDDFEQGDQRNALGGKHWTFASKAAAIGGEYAMASPNRVYQISYGGTIGDLFTYSGWATQLGGVDCSQCGTVSFMVKGVDGGEKPNIYLDDGNHRWPVPIEKYIHVTPAWQRVTIPLSEYSEYGVDLTHLAELQVVLEWERMSGTISIDDVRFGPQ